MRSYIVVPPMVVGVKVNVTHEVISFDVDDPPAVRHTTVGRPLEGYEFRASPDGELDYPFAK